MMERLQSLDPLAVVGIGLTAFAINYLATAEIIAIQKREAFKAGLLSAVNCLLGSILLYAFVNDVAYAVPELIGTFVGTYLMTHANKTGAKNTIGRDEGGSPQTPSP